MQIFSLYWKWLLSHVLLLGVALSKLLHLHRSLRYSKILIITLTQGATAYMWALCLEIRYMSPNSELILHACTQLYGGYMGCARVFKRLQGILEDEFWSYIRELTMAFHDLLAYNACRIIPQRPSRYIRHSRLSFVHQTEPFTGTHQVSARTALRAVLSDACHII